MSVEALWSINFATRSNEGAGVIVLETGRLFGGDSSFCWTGTYELSGNRITGEAHVRRHADYLPSLIPGLDDYRLTFEGDFAEDEFTIFGSVLGAPSDLPQMGIGLKKIAELP